MKKFLVAVCVTVTIAVAAVAVLFVAKGNRVTMTVTPVQGP